MNYNKTIRLTMVCAILGVGLVILLFSASARKTRHKNGFTRNFINVPLEAHAQVDLKYAGYYLAGFSSQNIFLGNTQTPKHLLKINHLLTDSVHYQLHLPNIASSWEHAKVVIDSPSVYISEGVTGAFFYGTLSSLKMKRIMENSPFFSNAIPLSPSSIFLRSIDQDLNRFILIKHTDTPPFVQKVTNVLEKQIDGIFCTDGMLRYDKQSQYFIYLYYYRNEFICLDANLGVKYKSHTIDTNRVAKIKVDTIRSENSVTLSEPPLLVNKKSCLFGNILYVQPALQADNEEWDSFHNNFVVDSYSLTDGSYQGSFYIPINHDGKVIDFQIVFDKIFLITNTNSLHMYKLHLDHKTRPSSQ